MFTAKMLVKCICDTNKMRRIQQSHAQDGRDSNKPRATQNTPKKDRFPERPNAANNKTMRGIIMYAHYFLVANPWQPLTHTSWSNYFVWENVANRILGVFNAGEGLRREDMLATRDRCLNYRIMLTPQPKKKGKNERFSHAPRNYIPTHVFGESFDRVCHGHILLRQGTRPMIGHIDIFYARAGVRTIGTWRSRVDVDFSGAWFTQYIKS